MIITRIVNCDSMCRSVDFDPFSAIGENDRFGECDDQRGMSRKTLIIGTSIAPSNAIFPPEFCGFACLHDSLMSMNLLHSQID